MSIELMKQDSGGEIYALIPRVMADIGSVGKDRKNEQQRYSFRGIEDMYLAAHPAMVKHGIFCAPEVVERDVYRFEKVNEQGRTTTWCHVAVRVVHHFFASDGSYVDVVTWGEGLDNSDKATNKAMSGAMKYALIELFCVPTEDIQDSDKTSPETGTKRAAVPTTKEPVVFQKKETPVQAMKRAMIDTRQPELPVEESLPTEEDGYINLSEQRAISRQFRDALPEHLSSDESAKALLHSWLVTSGFYTTIGEPPNQVRKGTTKKIEKHLFEEVKNRAVLYASKCK